VIEWLDKFYASDDLRRTLEAAFGPAFASYAAEIWLASGGTGDPPLEFVQALASSYVTHHLDSSRIQLTEVVQAAAPGAVLDALSERFGEWAEKRPDKVAANETVRAANAIQLQQMQLVGAVRKVWVTNGGSCPYCRNLDGTVVGIEQPFFEPGDSFHPEGAETPLTFTGSIGHPPVHQGCNCSIASE